MLLNELISLKSNDKLLKYTYRIFLFFHINRVLQLWTQTNKIYDSWSFYLIKFTNKYISTQNVNFVNSALSTAEEILARV